MNKLILLSLLVLLILPVISASQTSLGTFKQNECIVLLQTCSNCSFINLSSVNYPDGEQALGQVVMTKIGKEYNKTFCSTSQIGEYNVNGYGDPEGIITIWNYEFEVTPSGFNDTLGFYLILIVVLGGVIILGFAILEGWFVVIGGLGFMILGLYSIVNGIAGFKDTFMTWAISVFLLGIGAYLAIKSAIELVEGIDLG